MQAQSCLWKRFTKFQSKVVHNSKHFLLVTCSRLSFNQKRSKPNKKVLKSIEMTSSVELPKLPENQKSYAGIPEAVFVVNSNYRVL